jgi:hypothetical protein
MEGRMRAVIASLILVCSAAAAMADPPGAAAPLDAAPIDAATALACAAARYRGEALRIDTERGGLIQSIRWLTPARNVLRIEITGPGCRFVLVDGVGQTEARILPAPAP